MHTFTITIHSHLFGKELDENILEKMAIEYEKEFMRLLKVHKLHNTFRVETYWSRGSLIQQFLLIVQDSNLVAIFASAGAYKVLKEYKSLRENVVLLAGDIKKISKNVAGIPVSIRDYYICDTKPLNNARRLEPSLITKDTNKKRNKKDGSVEPPIR